MTGGNRVVAIGAGGPETDRDEILLTEELAPREEEQAPVMEWAETEPQPHSGVGLLWPTLAITAVIAWTGVFAWSLVDTWPATPSPVQVAGWIRDWSVPAVLIGIIWLIAMRNSRSEARRFGDVTRQLSDESNRLEARLASINSELGLSREFMAAQSRDLDALGRQAVERLSQHSDRLQALIQDNGAQVHSLGAVSEAALDNMEKLRSQLPVIATSARDVASNIGNAGRTAHVQLQELIAGFKRLNEFGQASERQVATIRTQIATTIAEFSRKTQELGECVDTRHANFIEQGEEFRAQLQQFAEASMDATRSHLNEISDEIRTTHAALKEQQEKNLGSLRAQLAELREESATIANSLNETGSRAFDEFAAKLASIDNNLATRRAAHEEQTGAIAKHSEDIASRLTELDNRIAEVAVHATEAETNLRDSMRDFGDRIGESREVLTEMGGRIWELTDASVRLLELIQAGSHHSREEIPKALIEAEDCLRAVEARVADLKVTVEETGNIGKTLDTDLAASHVRVADLAREIVALHNSLDVESDAISERLASLHSTLAEIAGRSSGAAERARSELSAAIDALTQSANAVSQAMEKTSTSTIAGIADRLSEQSKAAVERALEEHGAQAAAQLEQVSLKASEASREAAIQLRDQLAMVNELAANLENRVAHARKRAEEQVDNDFSRRVALITETLNSNAIDITRALNSEVADTAWAQYLKGDRGIFTRRAVSLIAANETRPILQLYEADSEFRDHVSRYIHDFEAMLRQVLSTRNGNALGVTLLSSDMGKLYVALAQAIERLRS
jgi:hypothetical protein